MICTVTAESTHSARQNQDISAALLAVHKMQQYQMLAVHSVTFGGVTGNVLTNRVDERTADDCACLNHTTCRSIVLHVHQRFTYANGAHAPYDKVSEQACSTLQKALQKSASPWL